jgi:hypothetical protein
MSGSANGNASNDAPGPDDETSGDGARDDDAPDEFDGGGVGAREIGPFGAMIAVAFTGAAIGLAGAGVSLFAGDLGLALVGVGVVVALTSPIAYVRHRRLYGS